MTVLECKNIEIQYGYKPLLKNINLSLNPFDKKALVGKNGCGKTSLLRVLAGLRKPTQGQVLCMGAQIWPVPQYDCEHYCLFLSSQPALFLELSVLQNLKYYCRSYGIKVTQYQYEESLKRVGLIEKINSVAQTLSTGQKRRFTFAVLEIIKPKIILADEPTNGLDENGFNLCLQIFEELSVHNKSALLIATHDKNLIQWCDEKIILEQFKPTLKELKQKIRSLL